MKRSATPNADFFYLLMKTSLQSVQSLKVPVSAASIQGHFMQHKEDHLGAIDNVSCLKTTDGFMKTAD